jgi:hypothetical protein
VVKRCCVQWFHWLHYYQQVRQRIKNVEPSLNADLRNRTYMSTLSFNLGAKRRWMVSFTLPPLCSPRTPTLGKMLMGGWWEGLHTVPWPGK